MREQDSDFSSIFKRAREPLNRSQENLARELRMSFSTFNLLKNEKTQPITKLARLEFGKFCAKIVRASADEQAKLESRFHTQGNKLHRNTKRKTTHLILFRTIHQELMTERSRVALIDIISQQKV